MENYWLYGRAEILIQDDYHYLKDTIVDDTDLDNMIKTEKGTEADQEFIEKTTARYISNKDEVPSADRLKMIDLFGFNLSPKYKGVIKFDIILPKQVVKREVNTDIGFSLTKIKISDNVSNSYKSFKSLSADPYSMEESKKLREFLNAMKSIGYTEGYLRAALSSKDHQIEVDNDPYNNSGMYIASFCSKGLDEEDVSTLNAIIEPAVDYLVAKRRAREKVNSSYKNSQMFSMPGADQATIEAIKAEVDTASTQPEGYNIFTNQEISVNPLTLDSKDRIDLAEVKEDSLKDISVGLGMPDTLLNGGDSYSSGFLKVELLTNEYAKFRQDLASFIEDEIFRPIAIRKGFVTKDEWGDPVPIYPTVKFDKLSIARGTEDFNFLSSQVDSNRLPVKALTDVLGYDYDEIQSKLREELTSVFNPGVRDTVNSALSNMSSPLSQTKVLVDKLADKLGTPGLVAPKPEE